MEAWTFYNTIYRPKLFYPTKVLAFLKADWAQVTRKFTNAVIRKMGFNGHPDRRILFGPRRLGEIGLVSGYSQQGDDGLMHFLVHVRNKS